MRHTIRITQSLEGWVDIEADSREHALDIAFKTYVTDGEALPEMETSCSLQFDVLDYCEGSP
jgi:hypothetical protein